MSDHPTNASSAAEKPEQVKKPEMSIGAIIAKSKAAADKRRRQRQARQSKTSGTKRGLPQPKGEDSAIGERNSAASSEVVKRPRIEALNMSDVGIVGYDRNTQALVHKDDPSDMDFVARGGLVTTGHCSTAESFTAAISGVVENTLRNSNGRFQETFWMVKKITKKDRELAHRVYMQRSLPLEVQYEQEQRRRALEKGAAVGNTARPAVDGVPAPDGASAASAGTPAATESGEVPVVYKTGVDREGMDRNDLDAEMDEWRRENNMDVDK